MSKDKFLFFTTTLIVILSFLSCQTVNESRTEEPVKAHKAEVRKPGAETETKAQLQQSKQSAEQLTEQEQKTFKGCLEPGYIIQEDALKYQYILIKGDPETILWYSDYEKDKKRRLVASRRVLYQNDICTVVQALSIEKNKWAYSMILQIIEQKSEYPTALGCAIMAVNRYGEFKDGEWHGDKRSIPVLEKIVNNKNPGIRLHAAGALLSLGKGDIALPILDELAKAGIKESPAALKKLFAPEERIVRGKKRIVLSDNKLWDKRGKDILIRALNYSGNEVRALTALSLANMGIEKKSVEHTAIRILEHLKNRGIKDYKNVDKWSSDRNAGFFAISALEKIKSTAGIHALEEFIVNNNDPMLQRMAKSSLKKIKQK